jgi:hypothetical protein
MDTDDFTESTLLLTCDVGLKNAAYFLALLDRSFPFEYMYPKKQTDTGGYEIFKAMAAVGARLSLMCQRNECGLNIIFATGGAFATVAVQFLRPTGAAGSVTVRAGTVVSTSKGARQFETLTDAVFTGSALGPITVNAQAIARGYEYNVTGQRTSLGGEVLPGEIDTIDAMLQTPPYGDGSITVRQIADATGGEAAWLDGHGANRNMLRDTAEGDDLYRIRIRSVPDTVTPDAIIRAADNFLSPYGIDFELVETFDVAYQTCWDAPSPNVGTPTYQVTPPASIRYDHNTFVYDDPRDPNPFRNRWLDEYEKSGAFILVIDVTFPLSPTNQVVVTAMYRKLQTIKLAGVAAIMDWYHPW